MFVITATSQRGAFYSWTSSQYDAVLRVGETLAWLGYRGIHIEYRG